MLIIPNSLFKDIFFMLHLFSADEISGNELPVEFTNPFDYTPHPLTVIAAEKVKEYLTAQTEWKEELDKGKMFGVLVVQDENNNVGYLAAYSGILAGSNNHEFFVGPVYDLLQPDGFFKIEEKNISDINLEIKSIESNPGYIRLNAEFKEWRESSEAKIREEKNKIKAAKKERDLLRESNPSSDQIESLIKESQFQKAELKRMETSFKEKTEHIGASLKDYTDRIENLKQERKKRSAILQKLLFNHFRLLNAQGKIRNLGEIFEETAFKTPPAGAGECAGPKLLQYAFLNKLKPLAMAEFWWGNSPKTEVRRHGDYYPACKGKCEPILKFMLQGLDIKKDFEITTVTGPKDLEIIYEDDAIIVINKPAGLLSTPGKLIQTSVYTLIKELYPEITGPVLAHRLDMSTSGLLLLAKTKEIHKALQIQFTERRIKKRYVALLDGEVKENEGVIELPLSADILDRPRQIVDFEGGKYAKTVYKVMKVSNNKTKISLYPLTGRTHQLRVHCAHASGLNTPISGDALYGNKSERLFLHAESLEFIHPVTGEVVHFEKKADF